MRNASYMQLTSQPRNVLSLHAPLAFIPIEALPKKFFWDNYVGEILVEKWLPHTPLSPMDSLLISPNAGRPEVQYLISVERLPKVVHAHHEVLSAASLRPSPRTRAQTIKNIFHRSFFMITRPVYKKYASLTFGTSGGSAIADGLNARDSSSGNSNRSP